MARTIPNPKYPLVSFFDSIVDFCDCLDSARPIQREASFSYTYDFPRVKQLAHQGTDNGVAEATALVDTLLMEVAGNVTSWVPSVCGAYPVVAEFLANSPTPMRRRVTTSSEVSPMTVWVSTATASGVGTEGYRKRGIVILALVMMLIQQGRPVRLMVHGEDWSREVTPASQSLSGSYVSSVFPINTTPLDLGTACYALSGADVERNLMFYSAATFTKHGKPCFPTAVMQQELIARRSATAITGPNYSGATFESGQHTQEWIEFKAEAFGGDAEHDLFIAAPAYNSAILANPVKWIKDMLAKYGSQHVSGDD